MKRSLDRNQLAELSNYVCKEYGDKYEPADWMEYWRDISEFILSLDTANLKGKNTMTNDKALKWLMGEGPDDNGYWFGDDAYDRRHSFWWRKVYRAMIAAAPNPPANEMQDLAAENKKLREALGDLTTWFPDKPSDPEWRLKGGEYGADDAVEAARAALKGDDDE